MERHAALPDGKDIERMGNVARQIVKQDVAGAPASTTPMAAQTMKSSRSSGFIGRVLIGPSLRIG
jgi:hypothetical protein